MAGSRNATTEGTTAKVCASSVDAGGFGPRSMPRTVWIVTTIAQAKKNSAGAGVPVTVSGRCGGRASSHGVPSMVVPVSSSRVSSAGVSVIDRALPRR